MINALGVLLHFDKKDHYIMCSGGGLRGLGVITFLSCACLYIYICFFQLSVILGTSKTLLMLRFQHVLGASKRLLMLRLQRLQDSASL